MGQNHWLGQEVGGDSPAVRASVCTPDDNAEQVARALYVGTGGTVVVVPLKGETPVTFVNVQNGTRLNVSVKKVMSTTTASDILLLDPKV